MKTNVDLVFFIFVFFMPSKKKIYYIPNIIELFKILVEIIFIFGFKIFIFYIYEVK